MIISLLRHGETEANKLQQFMGSTDVPLSEEGFKKTRAGRIDPDLKHVYVTPLQRTQQTAAILYPNARQEIVPAIGEMSFGVFEGRNAAELEKDPEYIRWMAAEGMVAMPGGESRIAFGERVRDGFIELIDRRLKENELRTDIVAHGGSIMVMMALFALPKRPYQDWWVENLEGYRLFLEPALWHSQRRIAKSERIFTGAGDPPVHRPY